MFKARGTDGDVPFTVIYVYFSVNVHHTFDHTRTWQSNASRPALLLANRQIQTVRCLGKTLQSGWIFLQQAFVHKPVHGNRKKYI